jgi:hypothetical protein
MGEAVRVLEMFLGSLIIISVLKKLRLRKVDVL